MSTLTLQSKAKLRDGHEIPVLGYGTYELEGENAYNGVFHALQAGYRHIDSAEWYENERECGRAILDFCQLKGIPRSDVFFTTKLKSNNGYDNTTRAIQTSLDLCGLEYIDLYLIHGPIGGPQARVDSWRAICDAQKQGKVRSIGVSCFGVRHLEELLSTGLPIPAINQIDLHPFMTRVDVVNFCSKNGIVLEAWAPIVRGLRFKHASVVSLVEKYHKSAAQVLLRYSLQKGFIPLPKSASADRIAENANIFDFELAQGDIDHLDTLDEKLLTDWDPSECA